MPFLDATSSAALQQEWINSIKDTSFEAIWQSYVQQPSAEKLKDALLLLLERFSQNRISSELEQVIIKRLSVELHTLPPSNQTSQVQFYIYKFECQSQINNLAHQKLAILYGLSSLSGSAFQPEFHHSKNKLALRCPDSKLASFSSLEDKSVRKVLDIKKPEHKSSHGTFFSMACVLKHAPSGLATSFMFLNFLQSKKIQKTESKHQVFIYALITLGVLAALSKTSCKAFRKASKLEQDTEQYQLLTEQIKRLQLKMQSIDDQITNLQAELNPEVVKHHLLAILMRR